MVTFQRIQAKDYELQKVQNNCASFFDFLTKSQIIDGRVVSDVSLSTSDTILNHGLQREPVGYIIIKSDAPEQVYTSATVNPNKKLYLVLKATGDCTVSLWVF